MSGMKVRFLILVPKTLIESAFDIKPHPAAFTELVAESGGEVGVMFDFFGDDPLAKVIGADLLTVSVFLVSGVSITAADGNIEALITRSG